MLSCFHELNNSCVFIKVDMHINSATKFAKEVVKIKHDLKKVSVENRQFKKS